MKFKRFTKLGFLKQIGRALLGQFLAAFKDGLAEKQLTMPPDQLQDGEYFHALAQLAMTPDALPDNLIEALYAIEELANDDGQARLEQAVEQGELALTFKENSTQAEIVVQAWLAKPELVFRKHNELKLNRLSSFEYLRSAEPVDRRKTFTGHDAATVGRITADLDEWFQDHNRGSETTQIEVHPMDGRFWFVVRHGDTYARTPKVEKRKTEILHFRPARDDVVVYSPERDEIRIHARTKGERELYQKTFGARLFGDDEYFSERRAYTLEPLRTDGIGALDTDEIPGISEIVLREYEISFDGGFHEVLIRKADDIFAAAEASTQKHDPILKSGRLDRACFEIHFEDSAKPRKVEIRHPNVLKLGRHCDAALVDLWLENRGFLEKGKLTAAGAIPDAKAEQTATGGNGDGKNVKALAGA